MTAIHLSPPLISASQLRERLELPQLRLLDVRGTWKTPARALPEDYATAHIPGAAFLDWTKVFIEQGVAVGLASVADEDGATEAFAQLGISAGDLVVVYDDNRHMFAGRIWWAMRYWGFDNVYVLDGGLSHWRSLGYATSSSPAPSAPKGNWRPTRRGELRVSLEAFIAARDEACVIDGRGPKGYAGDPDNARSGHIPGASSVPHTDLLDDATGCFLDDAGLEAVFERTAPGWRSQRVVASCGSGYSGTVPMLALAKLGVTSTLYDGSFAEWKQDPARPVEQS